MIPINLEINVIDAFTNKVFGGNPAAVIITDNWLNEPLMQKIASENNLSETAFLVNNGSGIYAIRWFSPIKEIDFCGHATLASAFVLFGKFSDLNSLDFTAKTVGELTIKKLDSGKIQMSFPNTKPELIESYPRELLKGLSIKPKEIHKNAQAYFAIYDSEDDVLNVETNNDFIKKLHPLDVVVTAPSNSDEFDFISRYFWPANGNNEDQATGSIHTGLAPFWSERIGKSQLKAFQASKRGASIECEVAGDRVLISGNGVQYMTGTISL